MSHSLDTLSLQSFSAETVSGSTVTSHPALSWYNVSAEVKSLLQLAAAHWEDTQTSADYINQALEKAGDNPDVLVSAYRYFFYKRNDPLALQVAQKVLHLVRTSEQLPEAWEQLYPILTSRREESTIRLYLSAYSASGLILARLGAVAQAREIANQVSAIDGKEFGGDVILNILNAPPDEDEE
ncbi:MAG: hypothetical protein SFW36_13920 [Leptolyngbyaceae cyanobacterium bins.59]|nr:hypothetical protein [Leptolyngbyaceae cyanobacterium bins.59]